MKKKHLPDKRQNRWRHLLFYSLVSLGLGFFPRTVLALDVPQYQIKADYNTETKTLNAHEVVRWTNPGPAAVREVYFHIYPNRKYTKKELGFLYRYSGYFKVNLFPEGYQTPDFRLSQVLRENSPLTFSIEGVDETLLKVTLDKPLATGETVELTLDFSFRLPHSYGRLGWHNKIVTFSQWYPVLAVFENQEWNKNPFYPFHRPFYSEAAQYNVELTVPAEQIVVHTGLLTKEEPDGAGRKKLLIATDAPVRDFALALSPEYLVLLEDFNGVTIKSFYLPGDEAAARQALVNTRGLMEYYTEKFGPYPFKEFSIAPVSLGYGGEQKSNLIFIDTRAYKLPGLLNRYFDFLIAHETGHQWFYNIVGINEFAEMWLEEGINSFFISEYIEHKYGPDAQLIDFPEWCEDYEGLVPNVSFKRTRDYRYKQMVRQGFDHAVIDRLSSFQEPSSIFSVTYGKGSKVVAMLKAKIGEQAFNKIFQRIFAEHRFGNLSMLDFKKICEEESGQKLESFFDQWLYSGKYLDYAVQGVSGRTIKFENKGGITTEAPVKVSFADGTTETAVYDGKEETLNLGQGPDISSVAIDPDQTLLDIDRTNNFYKRKLYVKLVPFYLGLYDIPLFMPEDSYNVVVGPEAANGGIGLKAAVQKPYDQMMYAGSDYEFKESLLHSRVGYVLNNVGRSPAAVGVELSNTNDYDDGDDDLTSAKVFYRQELWPAQYGLTDINDHWTVYLIRNQRFNDSGEFLSSREDDRNIDYSRRNEAITGASLHLNRSGPYPDPSKGWQFSAFAENAGHYLHATQYFYRAATDLSVYHSVTARSKLAGRLKYGAGFPNDKELFYLGGTEGLRGYDRKSVRGSNVLLGSVEYRFPLCRDLDLYFLDNILGLKTIQGVVFTDWGQGWFSSFSEGRFKKDAGAGLRLSVDVGAMLEEVIVRLDVAQAIDDPDQDTQFWFGLSHAF
jgi:hypothetical protein